MATRKFLEVFIKTRQLCVLQSNNSFLIFYEKKPTDFILLNTFILVNYFLSKPLVNAIMCYKKPDKNFILAPPQRFLKTNRRGFAFKKLSKLELRELYTLELTFHTCISFYKNFWHLKFLKTLNISILNEVYLKYLSLTRGKKKKMLISLRLRKLRTPIGEFLLKSTRFVLYLIFSFLDLGCENIFNLSLRQFLLQFSFNKQSLIIYPYGDSFRTLKLINVLPIVHIMFFYPLIFIFMSNKANFYSIHLYLYIFTQKYTTNATKLTKLFIYLYLNRIQYTAYFNEKIYKVILTLKYSIEKNIITFRYVYDMRIDTNIKRFFKYINDIILINQNDIINISIFCMFRVNEQRNVKYYLLTTKNLPIIDAKICIVTDVFAAYSTIFYGDWYFNIKNYEFIIRVKFKDSKGRCTLFTPFTDYYYG